MQSFCLVFGLCVCVCMCLGRECLSYLVFSELLVWYLTSAWGEHCSLLSPIASDISSVPFLFPILYLQHCISQFLDILFSSLFFFLFAMYFQKFLSMCSQAQRFFFSVMSRLQITNQKHFSRGQILLRTQCSGVFQNGQFSSSLSERNQRGFFSDLYHEKLVELPGVKFKKV